jgi:hypothetical protein
MHHSQDGIFHTFAARFNTRNKSFRALSSVGKCPRVLPARRSLTAMKIAVPRSFGLSRFGFGVWCDHPGQGAPGARDVGRPFYSMSRELMLVAGCPLREARLRCERGSVGI